MRATLLCPALVALCLSAPGTDGLPVTFTLDRFELTAIGTREPAPAAAKPVS